MNAVAVHENQNAMSLLPVIILIAPYLCLVFLALCQADIDILSQVGRDMLAELLNVRAVDRLGEAERSVDNTGIKSEEVLGNLAGAWVLRIQRSHESGLLAIVVELEMDGSLGKDGAFELVQGASNLRVLA